MDHLCTIVTEIINPLMYLIAASAFIYFIFGLAMFINALNQGQSKSKEGVLSTPGSVGDGKRHMVWGLIGLVIIFSAYGIIKIAIATFGISFPTLSC